MTTRATKQALASMTDEERVKLLEAELARLKGEQVDEGIKRDEYISLMSLCPDGWHLNLSTKTGGQGKVYKFDKFGQIKKIVYTDVIDILENHRNFVEAGRFIVLDKRVIRESGLEDICASVLDKKSIEEILSGTEVDNCASLYSSANKNQQEIIIEILVERLATRPESVNMNLVDRITRLSGMKINDIAEERKSFFNAGTEKKE